MFLLYIVVTVCLVFVVFITHKMIVDAALVAH